MYALACAQQPCLHTQPKLLIVLKSTCVRPCMCMCVCVSTRSSPRSGTTSGNAPHPHPHTHTQLAKTRPSVQQPPQHRPWRVGCIVSQAGMLHGPLHVRLLNRGSGKRRRMGIQRWTQMHYTGMYTHTRTHTSTHTHKHTHTQAHTHTHTHARARMCVARRSPTHTMYTYLHTETHTQPARTRDQRHTRTQRPTPVQGGDPTWLCVCACVCAGKRLCMPTVLSGWSRLVRTHTHTHTHAHTHARPSAQAGTARAFLHVYKERALLCLLTSLSRRGLTLGEVRCLERSFDWHVCVHMCVSVRVCLCIYTQASYTLVCPFPHTRPHVYSPYILTT